MPIITIGMDLAKHIFAVHGVNEHGRAELVKPKVSRDQLLPLLANLPPCLIGLEACPGAHHWARLFRVHGHTIKRMAPKFVTPYRMSGHRGKNAAADTVAICEAPTPWVKARAPVLCPCCGAAMVIVKTGIRARFDGPMAVPRTAGGVC